MQGTPFPHFYQDIILYTPIVIDKESETDYAVYILCSNKEDKGNEDKYFWYLFSNKEMAEGIGKEYLLACVEYDNCITEQNRLIAIITQSHKDNLNIDLSMPTQAIDD